MPSLSVIVIAKNEASNLARCLTSVSFADEIIVLDSGSMDDTVNIAKQFTDKVYETDWQGYGIQKQRALSYASCDWVLNLDADEYVNDILQEDIQKALQSVQWDAFRVPIQMHFYDRPVPHSSSPSRHVRLYKRDGARYSEDLVHEKILLPKQARIGQIPNPLLHDSFRDISHALYKMNRYSSYSAKIRLNNQKTPGFLKTLIATGWMFFRCYILQRGFLDGKPGFILAFMNAQGTFYRGMKCIYPDQIDCGHFHEFEK